MNAKAVPSETTTYLDATETANDRFKKSFGNWFWGSMITATVLHFMMFQFWPEMHAEDYSMDTEELITIEIPPEVEIPPPPQRIARPATPVVSTTIIDEDITIMSTDFDDLVLTDLPPPPPASGASIDVRSAPTFTPMTVEPVHLNRAEIMALMQREYPATLRDAGIGGRVEVDFFIETDGTVGNRVVKVSSGQSLLDQAALRVADAYRFSPARNREEIVPVWVTFAIVFTVGAQQ